MSEVVTGRFDRRVLDIDCAAITRQLEEALRCSEESDGLNTSLAERSPGFALSVQLPMVVSSLLGSDYGVAVELGVAQNETESDWLFDW